MDRDTRNKIGAAVSLAVVVAMGASWAGDLMVPVTYPARSAYRVPDLTEPTVDLASLQRSWPAGMGEEGSRPRLIGYMVAIDRMKPIAPAAAAMTPPPPEVDLGTRLAASDPAKGAGTAKVCGSCHSFDRGGPDRTGPNLWGVVGRDIGSHAGFTYSKALAGAPGSWTYENLDRYLASPARSLPGNKMAFSGIRNANDRASLLAYLGSLSSQPPPYPRPAGKDGS